MKALIAELERATEGSRDLDNEIFLATHPEQGTTSDNVGYWYAAHTDEDGGPWLLLPFYTTSLDAALTLVPEGHRCSFDIPGAEGGRNHATVVKYSQVSEAVNLKTNPEEIIKLWNHSYGATPALALCAASLKARQAMKDAA